MNSTLEHVPARLRSILIGVVLIVLVGALLYTVCVPRDVACISCSDGNLTVWEVCVSYLRLHPLVEPSSALFLLLLVPLFQGLFLPAQTPSTKRRKRDDYDALFVPRSSAHLIHCVFLL